jgi:stage V sporulation protein B
MPIMGIFDASMVIVRLTASGFDLETAQAMYGSLSGFAQSIVNLPQIVTAAVQISIVPAIAKLKVLNDQKALSHNVEIGLRLAMIIGLPCAVGIGLLSYDIMKLLYPLQPEVWEITGGVLGILGWSIVFLSTYQISTGIIQGMGKPGLPAINLFVGAMAKMTLTYVLVGMPQINIYGAAIATASAFAIASILNISYILFVAHIKISYSQVFIKPIIDVFAMGMAVKLSNLVFGLFLPDRLNTIFTIIAGGSVYVIMLFVTNTITKEELDMMPGGAKLAKLSDKLSFKKK